jgi:hypothetical protein
MSTASDQGTPAIADIRRDANSQVMGTQLLVAFPEGVCLYHQCRKAYFFSRCETYLVQHLYHLQGNGGAETLGELRTILLVCG